MTEDYRDLEPIPENGNDFIADVSSRFEFVFFDAVNSLKLADKTRALVKHKDGFLEMAVWVAHNKKWIDEGSYCNCGGIGGDITDDVIEFALNGC